MKSSGINPDLSDLIRAIDGAETLSDGEAQDALHRSVPLPSRYRKLRELGRGGEAEVFAAIDLVLGRRVAIKAMKRGPFDDGMGLPGLREARIMARLDHPGIAAVHDVLFLPERTYLVMRLIPGCALGRIIKHVHDRDDRLTPRLLLELVDVVIRLCEAIEHAHEAGILHLDVKPENVMVAPHGQVCLMDWGASHGLRHRGTPPEVLGTPAYMAPEQWTLNAEELDGRADVYGLGALLFSIVEGRPPPDRLDQWTFERAIGGIEPILREALAFDRARRLPTVGQLRRRLVEYQRGHGAIPTRYCEPGTIVVREGEPGEAAFFIESGRCEAFVERGGEIQVLGAMGRGELFGELSLFSSGVRTASVRAVEPTTLRVIEHAMLQTQIDGSTSWMGAMVKTLARRASGLSPLPHHEG